MSTLHVRDVETFRPEMVQYRKLWESVLAGLRLSIIRGEFPAGTRLVETELASRFGVSRGPVREALRQLELEGLVMNRARRSVTVVGITEKDVHEIYSLRILLECYAIEQASHHGTGEQIAQLRVLVQDMRDALARRQIQAVIEADMVFHRSLIEMANHGRLTAIWEIYAAPVLTLLAAADSVYQDMPAAIEGHSMVVDAIEQHDARGAAKLMRRYLIGGEQIILSVVRGDQQT